MEVYQIKPFLAVIEEESATKAECTVKKIRNNQFVGRLAKPTSLFKFGGLASHPTD